MMAIGKKRIQPSDEKFFSLAHEVGEGWGEGSTMRAQPHRRERKLR